MTEQNADIVIDDDISLEHELRVISLRANAFSDDLMKNWNLEHDDHSDEQLRKVINNYVENFSRLGKKGHGLLLYGPVGTGKTYAACAAANALIEREIPCLVTNFVKLSNKLQQSVERRQQALDDLKNYELLVIDDLGAERSTDYMNEVVYSVIDARYHSGLPMIITTNMDIEELKNPKSTDCARIYDRILERCFPVKVDGPSRRRAAVRRNYDEIRAILYPEQ